MNENFRSSLRTRDTKESKKSARQRSKEGKIRRHSKYLAAFVQSHKEQTDDSKTNKTYSLGVVLKEAKKQPKDKLTTAAHSPERTKKELL